MVTIRKARESEQEYIDSMFYYFGKQSDFAKEMYCYIRDNGALSYYDITSHFQKPCTILWALQGRGMVVSVSIPRPRSEYYNGKALILYLIPQDIDSDKVFDAVCKVCRCPSDAKSALANTRHNMRTGSLSQYASTNARMKSASVRMDILDKIQKMLSDGSRYTFDEMKSKYAEKYGDVPEDFRCILTSMCKRKLVISEPVGNKRFYHSPA